MVSHGPRKRTGALPVLTILLISMLLLSGCNFPWDDSPLAQGTLPGLFPELGDLPTRTPAPPTSAATTTPFPTATRTLIPTATTAFFPTATTSFFATSTSASVFPTPTSPTAQATTASGATVTANQDANCHAGASTDYEVLGVLSEGSQATVTGRTADDSWWLIPNPSKTSGSCWVSAETTTFSGDSSQVPIVDGQPTPSANASFAADFSNVHACGGTDYAVFAIENLGAIPLESSRIIITLEDGTPLSNETSDAPFMGSEGECPGGADRMDPGQQRYVAGSLGSPTPNGENAIATIRLCSEDGLQGSCAEATLEFKIP